MLFYAYLIIYFCIYSVLGWICETIFCYILKEKGKRGFLKGPYCPIYGVGAVTICYSLIAFKENIILVFLLSATIAVVLEYFTGYVLETVFNKKWWDYSDREYNVKGRICLGNTMLFGIMGVLAIYFIHPVIVSIVENFGYIYITIVSLIIFTIFMYDTIVTTRKLLITNDMTNLTID